MECAGQTREDDEFDSMEHHLRDEKEGSLETGKLWALDYSNLKRKAEIFENAGWLFCLTRKVRHKRRAWERGQKEADIYPKEADPFCFYLENSDPTLDLASTCQLRRSILLKAKNRGCIDKIKIKMKLSKIKIWSGESINMSMLSKSHSAMFW